MVVKLCHRLSRAAWCYGWERKATAAFAELDESASDLERAETAIAMLWPLARRVFLMYRVDVLSYSEISEIVGIDVMTVVICIFDALVAISRSEERTSELQSLMRTSYAALCLNKQKDRTILRSTRKQ